MSQKPQSHPQPVAPIQRRDPTDPFQSTSRAPISPGPNVHVPDPAYMRACLREYNIGQMQNVLRENAPGDQPISYAHLRVIRQVIDRTMDDEQLSNNLRDLAIMLITHRVERCIEEQRSSSDYPAMPQDQRAMTLLETLSAERELMLGRLPEPTAAESRRARLKAQRQQLRAQNKAQTKGLARGLAGAAASAESRPAIQQGGRAAEQSTRGPDANNAATLPAPAVGAGLQTRAGGQQGSALPVSHSAAS